MHAKAVATAVSVDMLILSCKKTICKDNFFVPVVGGIARSHYGIFTAFCDSVWNGCYSLQLPSVNFYSEPVRLGIV